MAPSKAIPPNVYGLVRSQFALAVTLYHGWTLLNCNGLRALRNYLRDLMGKVAVGNDVSKAKKSLMNMQSFKNLMLLLDELADKGSNHPKLDKVTEIVTDHFRNSSPAITT